MPNPDPMTIHAARRVSEASVVFSAVSATLAVVLGVESSSIVLTAFGAIGYVDMMGSVALVHHFRHALQHDELEDRFERRAHLVVAVGLVAVGSGAFVASIIRLVGSNEADVSPVGIVLAALSFGTLLALSVAKQRIGARLPSPALVADGHLSGIGAVQAVVTLAGIGATTWFGWTNADAIAAMVVGTVAFFLGVRSLRTLRG
jgi:divalent metal cation (Fe/Co/Zn/Cd) transporter